MHSSQNIERQEERESGSLYKKLKRRLMIEFPLIKCIGDNFRAIAIALLLC